MSTNYVNKIIDVAKSEIGYLEKASNAQLDSKTLNAGYKNFTKYARDMDNLINFYDGKKNGYPWCMVFVNWCFVKAFGVDETRRICYIPIKSGAASCTIALGYYKKNGMFYSTPKTGDQVFFYNSKNEVAHTGIVEKVTSETLYTIEGNTSSQDGVIENGGSVCRKSYPINYKRIVGYGRPSYDVIKIDTVLNGEKTIYEIQKWLNKDFDSGLVLDNKFGPKTKVALIKAAQKIIGVVADGVFGNKSKAAWKLVRRGSNGDLAKIVQATLICLGYSCGNDGADGIFGSNSVDALKRFQKVNRMIVDGIAGKAVVTKLFS